ncbi:MAG TPA: tripartite tricarboxylate transporter TctB family protein [Halanaerobiales bacterium]|nr:tripartite tricarboxylate transporter TctB family protein [Halanaerobiales bacterium]
MGELIIAILFLILSLIIFLQAGNLPDSSYEPLGPAGFPRIIVLAMGILAIFLIVKKIKKIDFSQASFDFKNIFKKYKLIFITLINFLFYILIMRYIGFRISTFIFVFVTQLLLGPRKEKKYLVVGAIALVISLGSYYFFQNYLGVIFPAGIFFE